MSIEKKDLWQLLFRVENKARSKAQSITGVLCVSADTGREALSLLNRKLGKREETRLKRYRLDELERAEGLVQDPEFLKELTAFFVQRGFSPESQLAVLRAKQLLDPSVEIPRSLVEQARLNQPEHLRQLWDDLEGMGFEVCELSQMEADPRVVGFKIRTPLGTFLDYGTVTEIRVLGKKILRSVSRQSVAGNN